MSSESFFIHGIRFDAQGHGQRLTWEEAIAWHPGEDYLWLHLDYKHRETHDWLKRDSGLDPLVIDALLNEETRPRISQVGSGLLIALRGVNLNPGANPEDMVSIRIWLDETRMISTRNRVLLSVRDLAEQFAANQGPTSPADLLIGLSARLTARMEHVIDEIEDRMAGMEEAILAENEDLRHPLAELRRQLVSLRRYLGPQREALLGLQTVKVAWLSEHQRLSVREVNDRLTRYLEDLNAIRERASLIKEELLSQASERLNQRMYVLSVIAAIFLPLGFLTGLLGINVGGIPGTDNPYAFALVILMLVAVVWGQYLLFRKKRWL